MAHKQAFDIYALDKEEAWEDESLVEKYIDALITRFRESPEGRALMEQGMDIGFWAEAFVYYSCVYDDVTLPHITVDDVKHLLFSTLPRKVTPDTRENTRRAIAEFIALWKYLAREYQLPNARSIIRYLEGLDPEKFVDAMYDPRRFGPAKAFAMEALAAGVDLTDDAQMAAFVMAYNQRILAQGGLPRGFDDFEEPPFSSTKPRRRRASKNASKKKKRKAAKLARRRGRRKKR